MLNTPPGSDKAVKPTRVTPDPADTEVEIILSEHEEEPELKPVGPPDPPSQQEGALQTIAPVSFAMLQK